MARCPPADAAARMLQDVGGAARYGSCTFRPPQAYAAPSGPRSCSDLPAAERCVLRRVTEPCSVRIARRRAAASRARTEQGGSPPLPRVPRTDGGTWLDLPQWQPEQYLDREVNWMAVTDKPLRMASRAARGRESCHLRIKPHKQGATALQSLTVAGPARRAKRGMGLLMAPI